MIGRYHVTIVLCPTSTFCSDPQGIIRALREAAERSITIGKKIVDNSERIAAALKDAVVDISAVVSEGMVDVGGAFAEVSESVAKAGVVLAKAKAFTDDLNTGVEDAATQVGKPRGI